MSQFGHYYARRAREEIKVYAFFFVLLMLISATLVFSFMSFGPIILGTELNTNGSIEYLCLGAGCENLRPMDW